ncbi:hypothetical protein D9M72_445620 [compost metagenome]
MGSHHVEIVLVFFRKHKAFFVIVNARIRFCTLIGRSQRVVDRSQIIVLLVF